jgi:hypothetical protein
MFPLSRRKLAAKVPRVGTIGVFPSNSLRRYESRVFQSSSRRVDFPNDSTNEVFDLARNYSLGLRARLLPRDRDRPFDTLMHELRETRKNLRVRRSLG